MVDLAATPTACVRFDRHTLYLGTPGADQDCPSDLIGKTEALLVEPAAHAPAEQGTEQDPAAHETRVDADTVTVTGTYDDDPGLIAAILEGAGLPGRPRPAEPAVRGAATASRTAAATASVTATALPSSVTNHRGKGFDTCAAPSAGAMNTWKDSSPYDAVGIYIGGSMRACSQPNLTPSWVKDRAEDGWKFIPLYLGIQAEDITAPAAQGAAAADDAVRNAADLGFGPGSLIYYDMEAYPPPTAPTPWASCPRGPSACTRSATSRPSTAAPRPASTTSPVPGADTPSPTWSSTRCGTATRTPRTPSFRTTCGPITSGSSSTPGTSPRPGAAPRSRSTATTWT